MWFFWALICTLAWGGSDLFSKMGTDPMDRYSHWRLIIAVGTVMGLHAIGYILFTGVSYNPINILKYFPVSFLYILAMVIGYAGLRYIALSISSPICNSSGAVASLLCFLILGQSMSGLQLLAVALICGGIVMLAIYDKQCEDYIRPADQVAESKYRVSLLAITLPIIYCFIDGLGTFADALVLDQWAIFSEAEANLSYEFTYLLCAIFAYLYLTRVRKQPYFPRKEKLRGLAAVCETIGQFFYVFAIADNAIVAAPMISSYSIFSVLFSRLFLKEKLSRRQYGIILMVLVGIAILGLAEEL